MKKTKLPTELEVDSLDYTLEVKHNRLKIGCQEIDVDDVGIIIDFLCDCYNNDLFDNPDVELGKMYSLRKNGRTEFSRMFIDTGAKTNRFISIDASGEKIHSASTLHKLISENYSGYDFDVSGELDEIVEIIVNGSMSQDDIPF